MTVWSAMDAPPGEVEPDPAALGDGVAGELGVDDRELSAQQLGARSLRLRREIDSLRVALARTDAEFERRRAYRELDPTCTKASQWLAAQLRLPTEQARTPYLQARRLAQLPALQTALIAGVVSWWHACLIAKAASSPARTRQLRADLSTLIDAAATLPAREFGRRMTMWVQLHFTAETEADALAAEHARTASAGRNESAQPTLSARLHPVFGTEVLTELSRIERRLFELDWAEAKAEHGDATRFEHLARTSEQRRADALVEMARRSDAATPGAARRRPLATMLVGFDRVRARVAELEDGTVLTTDQALRALNVADLERAVLGPDDRVSISTKTRLFRGAERRAVEVRDRTCTQVGCEAPPEQCDVDHIQRFEHDGPTEQGNGRLRCVAHHEGRRRDPGAHPLPWEYAEEHWPDIEAQRAEVVARSGVVP